MNSDVVQISRSDYNSIHPFAPAVLSLASTTDTTIKFVNTTGPALVSLPVQTGTAAQMGSFTPSDPNANPAILGGNVGRPGAGYRGAAPYFSTGSFDGRPFIVQASFKCHLVAAGGGASVWTPKMWLGTNATPASNSAILATTGISVPASHTADLHGYIQATLLWDGTSLNVDGEVWSILGGYDQTAAGAITAVYNSRGAIAAITQVALANMSFLTSVVIGTTAPTSSSTTLTELSLSQI